MMRIRPILILIAVCLQQSCQTPRIAGIPLGTIAAMAGADGKQADGFAWARVTNGLQEQGFDVAGGAIDYGKGCWTADASLSDMATTLFVDREGRIYEEFPPLSCVPDTK